MKKFLLSIFAVLFAFAGVQAEEATLSFADKAQRTSYSSTSQVWQQNGITLTNNKASSTNNVADYAQPVRLYAKSNIVVECSLGNITKIVFDCNSSSYATALKNSIGSTATASSDKVTVTLDGTSNSFTVASLTAQVRMDALTVTYEKSEGGETPTPVDVAEPTFTPADGTTFETETLDVTINVEEGLTAYYSVDNKASYIEGKTVKIEETTTVYAYAQDVDGNKSDVVSATYTKVQPVDPNAKEVEATISFASTTNRVSQDSNSQVWSNDGVTFTNNKASSGTNVGNYSNPVRCYAGSNIVVEHTAMTRILFVCNSSSYATELKNSIGNDATVDGSNVTVTFANPVDKYTVEKLNAQVRLNSLTVTYLTTQKVVKAPTFTPESCGFYAGEEIEVAISAEDGATIYYTMDGSDPTTNSGVYSDPFVVNETTTVKAIAVIDGTESEVATAVYTKGIVGTVADALDAYVEGERLPAVVTGYIVGYVNGNSAGAEGKDCVFAVGGEVRNSNILIANDPNETDYTKCIAVQLPNNEIRAALNLADNPANLNKKVVVKGSLEKYLEIPGLKDVVAGELVENPYTLNVSAVGYATLYLDYNATIPAGVEVYTVTAVNDGYVTLTQVKDVLPANTGVIVKAAENEYTFAYSTETATAVEDNLLKGTVAATNITEDAYVLTRDEEGVCFGKAIKNQLEGTAWLNNANKAYLPASEVPANVKSLSFRFGEGTTGVENVEVENAVNVIYDLTGRRVEAITAPGIYIVNGKKILVK